MARGASASGKAWAWKSMIFSDTIRSSQTDTEASPGGYGHGPVTPKISYSSASAAARQFPVCLGPSRNVDKATLLR
jgi:hypothetical protein